MFGKSFANFTDFYAWMFGQHHIGDPGDKAFFLMGCEFGQWRNGNHDSSLGLGVTADRRLRARWRMAPPAWVSAPPDYSLISTKRAGRFGEPGRCLRGIRMIDFHDGAEKNSDKRSFLVDGGGKSRDGKIIVLLFLTFIVNGHTGGSLRGLTTWRSRAGFFFKINREGSSNIDGWRDLWPG